MSPIKDHSLTSSVSLTLLVIILVAELYRLTSVIVVAQNLVSNDPADVRFYLFPNSSNTEEHVEILHRKKTSVLSGGYNRSKPLILHVHGMLSNYLTATDVQLVKTAFLESGAPAANLIIVDYSELTISRLPFLLSSLSFLHGIGGHLNTITVATRIADFVQFLIKAKLLSGPSDVQMIGFSLGCHISGVTGRLLYERTGQLVNRITGLDPSPQFPLRNWRLSKDDAAFVDVSYTSLATLGNMQDAFGQRQGHVQFYLNGGGPHQPNCPNVFPFVETFCSHGTAAYYFAKSVKIKDIQACKCTICSREFWLSRFGSNTNRNDTNGRSQPENQCEDPISYGQFVPKTARGNYYVHLS